MQGICFIDQLVPAVVKERKTHTRRIITKEEWMNQPHIRIELSDDNCFAHFRSNGSGESFAGIVAKYAPNETIFIKEPYLALTSKGERYISYSDYTIKKVPDNVSLDVFLKVEQKSETQKGYLNKLFMPAWAARHFIEIVSVRAERLQDISEEDCIKEGIDKWENYKNLPKACRSSPKLLGWSDGVSWDNHATAQEAYASLIDHINGKGTWEKNPFVWVYDFKYVRK